MTVWPEFEHPTYDSLETARNRPIGGRVVWFALLLVGVVVYELTAQPALGAVVACGKFGWDDLRTGWWLRRHEQQPQGRVCSWFYFSAAFWRVAVTAAAAVFLIAMLGPILAAGQGQRLPNDVALLLGVIVCESLGGFVVSGIVTAIATLTAVGCNVQVWIDRGLHQARRDGTWPPDRWLGNRAPTLLFGAAFVFPVPVLAVLSAAVGSLGPPMFRAAIIVVLLVIAWPVLVLWLRDILVRKVAADSPGQCWPGFGTATTD